MANRDQILSSVLKKENGKLVYQNKSDGDFYKIFVEAMEEGQTARMFMEADVDDGTLTQIAKAKVCIRKLAIETGDSFEDIQLMVKKKSGLCFVTKHKDETVLFCKSFADCSRDELSLAITAIIELGDYLGVNCR